MANGNGKHPDPALAALAGARALVTGGAGAIGCNLVRQLAGLGAAVSVIDDFSSGRRANLADFGGAIRLIEGDVADEALLDGAFAGGVDYVFHLAALFANQNSVEHPEADLHTNGLGTLRMLQRASAHGVARFVFASSSCVYGSRSEMLDETLPAAPDTPYGITKVLGEQYTRFFAHQHQLATAVVRYFNSYGPGELPGRYRNVIPNFFALAAAGEPLPITGTGEETRDFTYVDDIVRGTLLAAVAPGAEGGVFNLGTGAETRIVDLAERVNAIAGNDAGIELLPRRDWDQIPRRCARIDKARQVFDYRPQVGFDEGLARYWRWYVEAREETSVVRG